MSGPTPNDDSPNVRNSRPAREGKPRVLRGHEQPVSDFAIRPDGLDICTATLHANKCFDMRTWDVRSGAQKDRMIVDRPEANLGFAYSIEYSPNGDRIAVSDGSRVLIWSIDTNAVAWVSAPLKLLTNICFSHAGDTVYVVADGTVAELCATSGTPSTEYLLSNLSKTPDGRVVAANSEPLGLSESVNALRIKSYLTNTLLKLNAEKGAAVAECGPGNILVVATNAAISIRDSSTGLVRKELEDSAGFCTLALSQDGMLIAGGTRGYDYLPAGKTKRQMDIVVWEATQGKRVKAFVQEHSNQPSMFTDSIRALAFFPNGERLASCGNVDGGVRLWSLA
jgi:WD40 repeat protein